jgi:hypothetical protein
VRTLVRVPAAVPCRQTEHPDDWFPDNPRTPRAETERRARRLCGGCRARVQCLQAALTLEGTGPAWGIFGGLTSWEREAINPARTRKSARPT